MAFRLRPVKSAGLAKNTESLISESTDQAGRSSPIQLRCVSLSFQQISSLHLLLLLLADSYHSVSGRCRRARLVAGAAARPRCKDDRSVSSDSEGRWRCQNAA